MSLLYGFLLAADEVGGASADAFAEATFVAVDAFDASVTASGDAPAGVGLVGVSATDATVTASGNPDAGVTHVGVAGNDATVNTASQVSAQAEPTFIGVAALDAAVVTSESPPAGPGFVTVTAYDATITTTGNPEAGTVFIEVHAWDATVNTGQSRDIDVCLVDMTVRSILVTIGARTIAVSFDPDCGGTMDRVDLDAEERLYLRIQWTADAELLSADIKLGGTWYPLTVTDVTEVTTGTWTGMGSILVAGPDATSNPVGTVVLPIGRNDAKVRWPDTPELIAEYAGPIVVRS